MKILVIQETDWITRYPHTQHHLFERLSLKGHTIKVIDYDFDWKKDPKQKKLEKTRIFSGISKIYPGSSIDVIRPTSLHIPILEYGFLMVSHYRKIFHQIKTFKPDLIVGFGILNAYLASRMAKRCNIPFLYYWIDALDTLIPEQYLQKIGRYVERKTIQNSKRIFVTNEKLIDHLLKLGADPSRIEIFSSGIDLTIFNRKIDGQEMRSKYGIKDYQIVLFFMGWIYHFSGLKEIAVQLAKEKARYENIVLFVVGEGDAYDDMIKIKEKYQLGNQIILTGKQPYNLIPKYIAMSDICILPAYPDEKIMQDIVPIKIFEYMAVGKPIITTHLSGVIREFGEGNGVVYVDTPEDTLLKSLNLFEGNEVLEIGTNGHRFIQSKDWFVITENFEKSLMSTIHAY